MTKRISDYALHIKYRPTKKKSFKAEPKSAMEGYSLRRGFSIFIERNEKRGQRITDIDIGIGIAST